ncbi:uncharacterized protein LOC128794129 isoform X2 [Vidua chalybeata]|uniref:uncharacterized protein LOC128794129 isoform X2 n=1 Tax=Vidua chalybeata TaxID=81927 RepID=UPI0023A8B58C|nr:uncharacterized protein LOC128794129 isoform X2 [Vidua chalybeata]
MALALRLFLLLLLAVALPARAAQAAPLQVRGADEHARKASPAAWLHADFQPLKPPAGVSAGKTFQAPFRVAAHKPSSHRRVMEGEAVLKAEFPGGSSGSLAASVAGREAMPGTVTGAWDHGLHHLERLANHGLSVLELGEGVSAGRTFPGPLVDVAHKPSSHRRGPLRRKNKPTGDSRSLEASKHLEQILSYVERRRGGCISLSLPLGLSSRGRSLHIWTHRARHSGKGSMAAWLPRCCFHGLQGCFPAWPGCSFSPASAGRHLAAADREPKLHHGPEIPCNFPVSGLMQRGSCLQEGGPWSCSKTLAIFLVFFHPLTSIAWSRRAQHRGIMACRLRGLGTGQSCAKGRQGACRPQLWGKQTKDLLSICTVLPAQQWSTARVHAPHCSHRCSRHLSTC